MEVHHFELEVGGRLCGHEHQSHYAAMHCRWIADSHEDRIVVEVEMGEDSD